MYGCETLKVFENKTTKRIFLTTRERNGRKLGNMHNEDLHNFLLFTKHYSDDQIKENEIGQACGMHKRDEKCIVERLKERNHWKIYM